MPAGVDLPVGATMLIVPLPHGVPAAPQVAALVDRTGGTQIWFQPTATPSGDCLHGHAMR